MGKYFGTDGFRGKANETLTAEKAFKVGRFLGWYYGQDHDDHRARIIIGKDTRRSSYMLEDALCAGLTSSGADAYLLHVTTTPSVSYCCRTDGFDCGIMISASHNPYYDNGIKIMRANGQKIEAEIEEKVEAYIDGEIPELPYAKEEAIGRTIDYSAGRNRYIGYLMTIPSKAFNGYRVGLDCANGASSMIAKSVFEALGAKTTVINNQPDGININDNCGSTHIEKLQELVRTKGLDVGFAYDGDADRCLAVDADGKVVNGDQIMYLCGKHMRENGQLDHDMIVTTVMTNLGFYKTSTSGRDTVVATPEQDMLIIVGRKSQEKYAHAELWSRPEETLLRRIMIGESSIESIAISPDGTTLAVRTQNGVTLVTMRRELFI